MSPVIVGLVIALLSVVPAWLAYRLARKKDDIAEQAGISTTYTTSIQQVVDGLNTHIENLRKDNADLRLQLSQERKERREEIQALNKRIAYLEGQILRYAIEDQTTATERADEDTLRADERANES